MKQSKAAIERLETLAATTAESRERQKRIEARERARYAERTMRARDLMLPSVRAAILKAGPALSELLASTEWRRLLASAATLRETGAPAAIAIPSMYISGNPYRTPESLRAVFKDERWSVNPHTGGVFDWTIGPSIILRRRRHFRESASVVFETRADLEAMEEWLGTTPFDPCVTAAVARLCEIVRKGQLVEMIAAFELRRQGAA